MTNILDILIFVEQFIYYKQTCQTVMMIINIFIFLQNWKSSNRLFKTLRNISVIQKNLIRPNLLSCWADFCGIQKKLWRFNLRGVNWIWRQINCKLSNFMKIYQNISSNFGYKQQIFWKFRSTILFAFPSTSSWYRTKILETLYKGRNVVTKLHTQVSPILQKCIFTTM